MDWKVSVVKRAIDVVGASAALCATAPFYPVIVAGRAKGQEVKWENLQEVWSKQKDEQAFEAYVVDAVRRHLGSAS